MPLAALAALAVPLAAAAAAPAAPRVPVVIELFTSEGCSSCPPADAVLSRLVREQPVAGAEILALGEHVDYWDRLGWKDPWSSAQSSERQGEYAPLVARGRVYTPQLVVDGRLDVLGSDEEGARTAVARAAREPHGRLRVDLRDGRAGLAASALPAADEMDVVGAAAGAQPGAASEFTVAVAASALPGAEKKDVMIAVVQDGLESKVVRGENDGKTLAHAAVVRSLVVLGVVPAGGGRVEGKVQIDPAWRGGALRVVAFAQERGTRRILAAATVPL